MAAGNVVPTFADMTGKYRDYQVPQLNATTILNCERKATSVSSMPNYGKLFYYVYLCVCVGGGGVVSVLCAVG